MDTLAIIGIVIACLIGGYGLYYWLNHAPSSDDKLHSGGYRRKYKHYKKYKM